MTESTRSLVGPIRTSGEVALWRNSILPLAVVGAAPLLAPAGLPIQVAVDSRALASHALDLVERLDEAIGSASSRTPDRPGQPTPEVAAQTLISSWVDDLSVAYGFPSALETLAWVFRNEVDWPTRERNWAWWRWIGAVHRGTADLPVLPGDAGAAVRDVIDRAVELASNPGYVELERQVERLLPRSREAEVLRRWTDPDGHGEFDYIGALRLARLREIGRAVSGIVVAGVDPAVLRLVLEAPGS